MKFEFPELLCETGKEGRFYTTPEGNRYPSVTTVLGMTSDNSWLQEWRDRVGKEEAEKITRQAGRRGTAVHDLAEKYLSGDVNWAKGAMPVNKFSFKKIKNILRENVTDLVVLEAPLYSDTLRTAGRVDCIGKWKGKYAIIDFKTSRREKSKSDIDNYFLQTSCYAYMMYERTGLVISDVVIVMTVDELAEGQVFEEKTRNWLPKFIERRNSLSI